MSLCLCVTAWLSLLLRVFSLLLPPVEGVVALRHTAGLSLSMSSTEMAYTMGDLEKLTTKAALASVLGPSELLSPKRAMPITL